MSLRNRRPPSKIPEVNLVPMMDVLMTVLTFFVIISMSLSGIQIFGVDLPSEVAGTDEELVDKAEPLVLGLTSDGQMLLENEPTDLQALSEVIRTYFSENPDGTLMLKADRSLPYSDVSKMLADLRSIGGKRVSLAVE
ncbi:MAG: biopolymer transporter ExbD [Cyanobacteria bacterium P01_G01_bin.38]